MISVNDAILRYIVSVWRIVDKAAVCLARLAFVPGGPCSWMWKPIHLSLWSHYHTHHTIFRRLCGEWKNDSVFFYLLVSYASSSAHHFWCILLWCIFCNTINSLAEPPLTSPHGQLPFCPLSFQFFFVQAPCRSIPTIHGDTDVLCSLTSKTKNMA